MFGEQKAVNNLSFEVQKGEVLGFLGPNGAGKSTTMKMITGYLPVTEGEITINGIDMQTNPLLGRRLIGYLPENNPLYKDMYVREYLSFVAGVFKIRDQSTAVNRVIDMTGLGVEQNKKIYQLSKGYKQRVGLAQALIHDPEILILDEPTTGLDPNQLGEIRTLIKTLGKEKTILFSTHIMQEVQAVCTSAIIIQKGQMVAHDSISGLSHKLSGANTIAFSMEKDIDMATLRQSKWVTSVEKKGNHSYTMSGKNALEMKKALFQLAVSGENTILQLQDETSNLEDIFKSLTQASKQD